MYSQHPRFPVIISRVSDGFHRVPVATPTRKRKRSGDEVGPTLRKEKIRRKRGSLGLFLQMPFDIICEVLSHLGPKELLMLLRTDKTFYDFLISRKSALFWRNARRNVPGLPDPPEWLSEIAYAKLAFDTLCTGCGTRRVYQVNWKLLARFCSDCNQTLVRSICYIDMSNTLKGLPLEPGSGWDRYVNCVRVPNASHIRRVLAAELEDLWNVWRVHMPVSQDMRSEFLLQKAERVEEQAKFGERCSMWDKETKRKIRLEAILQKCKDSGYEEELDKLMPELLRITLPGDVRSRGVSTGWFSLENYIRQRVIRIRIENLFRRRFALLCKIAEEFMRMFHGVFPSYAEIACDPQMRFILTQTTSDNLVEEDLRDTMSPIAGDILRRWDVQIRRGIDEKIRRCFPFICSRSPTELAIGTLMRCCACRHILEYPGLLSHRCSPAYDKTPPNPHLLATLESIRFSYWDSTFTTILRQVIVAYGADLGTTTAEDMDRSGARLYCVQCAQRLPGVMTVLSWRDAVAHPYLVHNSRETDFIAEGITWGRVPHPECLAAQELEAQAAVQMNNFRDNSPHWHCDLCSEWQASCREGTIAHIRSAHPSSQGLSTEGTEQDHIYYIPDSFPFGRGVYLISDHLTQEGVLAMSHPVYEALQEGKAKFHSLPEAHLGDAAVQTTLALYWEETIAKGSSAGQSMLPFTEPFAFIPTGSEPLYDPQPWGQFLSGVPSVPLH